MGGDYRSSYRIFSDINAKPLGILNVPYFEDDSFNDAELKEFLFKNGIGTLIFYPIAPHKQEVFKNWNDKSLPITENIHDQVISIPLNPYINNRDVEKIITVFCTINSSKYLSNTDSKSFLLAKKTFVRITIIIF